VVGLVCFFSIKAFLILAIITAKIIYLGFLVSCASRAALIIWIFRVLSLLRLSIVSYLGLGSVLGIKLVKFRFGFFKNPFYSRILVLLVFLYIKLKLLLSLGRCSS